MKRQPYNFASNLWGDVPEDPQVRETQLIGSAIAVGVAIACTVTEHFLLAALLLVSAVNSKLICQLFAELICHFFSEARCPLFNG
jgi:hypothetical protein